MTFASVLLLLLFVCLFFFTETNAFVTEILADRILIKIRILVDDVFCNVDYLKLFFEIEFDT